VRLNSLKPARGAKPSGKRLGRGVGSGLGKTAGRGHKGQYARAGGFHKVGFEGGQMPMQRRLPKRGFHSLAAGVTAPVRLSELNRVDAAIIDLAALKLARVIPAGAKQVKVYLSGKLEKPVTLRGLRVSKGARAAIAQAGGKVEE
jgi:large subunit ribosomal protein L15